MTSNTAYRNGADGFAFWYSPSVLRGNLALSNGRDDNRGNTAKESGNSWNEPGWSLGALRSTDPSSAEGPRRPDGSLPVTAFLSTTRPGVGATMTPVISGSLVISWPNRSLAKSAGGHDASVGPTGPPDQP